MNLCKQLHEILGGGRTQTYLQIVNEATFYKSAITTNAAVLN
jgi:hypothetical protein